MLAEPLAERGDGGALQVEVERGVDAPARAKELVFAQLPVQPLAHRNDIVRSCTFGAVPLCGVDEVHLGFGGLGPLLRCDEALLLHLSEHVTAAAERRIEVLEGVVAVGRLHEAGEERGLVERQRRGTVAEVEAACLLDAVGLRTEEDLVEVDGEDVVFAEVAVEFDGELRLLNLPLDGALRRQDEVLDHLLGDGAGALPHLSALEVPADSTDEAHVVHTLVLVEVGIFCGEQRLAHDHGDFVKGQDGSPDEVISDDGRDDLSICGVDAGRLRRSIVLQGSDIGQVLPPVPEEACNAGSTDGPCDDERA